jgi:saccharopine dehydrogenase-like NADP-dependent oxidoreductase
MKVIVLGSGKIGTVIAKDLSRTTEEIQVTLADIDINRAKEASSIVEGSEFVQIDTGNRIELTNLLSEYDLVLGALPGDYGYDAIDAAIDAKIDMVDISFTPEVPLKLDEKARSNDVTVVPDCGVAPGLSNILVGYSASKLDKLDEVKIMVGGIPETPVPPLGYTITWSVDGLIDEYIRPVKIVEEGIIVEVPPLSGLEEVEFTEIGRLEAFFTDGLRTLTNTMSGVRSMWEKTLRYPGHVSKINLLKDLGFLSEKTIDVKGLQISPRDMTAELLERNLWIPEIRDLLVMRVEVFGQIDGDRKGFSHELIDRYDRANEVSAMGRTTAYTASTVAGILGKGLIEEKGIVPPECLGTDEQVAQMLFKDLERKGIFIETHIF